MKRFVSRSAVAAMSVLGFLLVATRLALEFLGYASIPDDVQNASELAAPVVTWIFELPPWLPWTLLILAIAALALLARNPRRPSFELGQDRGEAQTLSNVVGDLRRLRAKFSAFRTQVDRGSLKGRPMEQLRRLALEHRATLRTLEKLGYRVPYLDVQVDPVGYIEMAIEHSDLIVPLVNRGHGLEARAASELLAERFVNFQAHQESI